MKTNVSKVIFSTIIALLVTSNFSVCAQEFFFDKKWEGEKVISKIKYEPGHSGLHEKTYLFEYRYDDADNLLMEDVYQWNRRKSNWAPHHRILRTNDPASDRMTLEYLVWNKKKNHYDKPSDKMIYKINSDNELIFFAFQKNNKLKEEINLDPEKLFGKNSFRITFDQIKE